MTPIALADAANERGRQYVNKAETPPPPVPPPKKLEALKLGRHLNQDVRKLCWSPSSAAGFCSKKRSAGEPLPRSMNTHT
jgi:hypothetical protein